MRAGEITEYYMMLDSRRIRLRSFIENGKADIERGILFDDSKKKFERQLKIMKEWLRQLEIEIDEFVYD